LPESNNYGAKCFLKMFRDKIWGAMEKSVYEKKIQNVDELHECTVEENGSGWISLPSTLPSHSGTIDQRHT